MRRTLHDRLEQIHAELRENEERNHNDADVDHPESENVDNSNKNSDDAGK